MSDLKKLVLEKIAELGAANAKEYFGVSAGTISAWKNEKAEPSLAAAQKVMAVMPPTRLIEIEEAEDPKWAEIKSLGTPESVLELMKKGMEVAEVKPEPVNVSGAVTLLMPMYEGIPPESFTTLVRACKLYGMDKVSIIPRWRTLIIEARNDLAHKFLASKAEWCIFIDADGVFPCGSGPLLRKIKLALPEPKASRNIITQLMSHPADKLIVGAVYKDRTDGIRAQCELGFRSEAGNSRLMALFETDPKKVNNEDGLEECPWVGFAAVRIHRSVFERMKEAAKPGGVLAEIAPPAGREAEPYGFFDTNRQARGEDVKFCRRAGQLGIKVWLDRGCLLGHFGAKIY